VGAIREEMKVAHWLMFERLQLRLTQRGQTTTFSALQATLRENPLCDLVARHPLEVGPGDIQILIWQEDAADA